MKINFTALVIFLTACSDKDSVKLRLPTPGQKQRPQVYVLEDENQKAWWAFRGRELEEALGAHVEEKSITSIDEGIETLKVWSARPITFLVLGPGLAQQAYGEAHLAKSAERIVFALGGIKNPDWIAIQSPAKKVAQFLEWICARDTLNGCDLKGSKIATGELSNFLSKKFLNGSTVVKVADPEINAALQSALNVKIKWAEVFGSFLKINKQLSDRARPTHFEIDFSSGFLQASPSLAVKGAAAQKLNEKLKSWALKELESQQGAAQNSSL